MFVANASFNNLGRPLWSTGINWGRATLGTILFVWWGAHYGPISVMVGQAAGVALFGSLAIITAFAMARGIGQPERRDDDTQNPCHRPRSAHEGDVKGAQLLTLEKIGVSRFDLNLETAVDRSQPHATL